MMLFATAGQAAQGPLVSRTVWGSEIVVAHDGMSLQFGAEQLELVSASLHLEPVTGARVTRGDVLGTSDGMFVLAEKNGVMYGVVWSSSGVYEIVSNKTTDGVEVRRAPQDQHEVLCDTVATGASRVARRGPIAINAEAPSPTRIDEDVRVLVALTTTAQTELGGTTAAEVYIAVAVATMNECLSNGQVTLDDAGVTDAEVTLAGIEVVPPIVSASSQFYLRTLRSVYNPQYSSVHIAREEEGADVVAMILENGASGPAGIACTGVGAEEFAFFVGGHNGVAGDMLFSHEFGHVFGAAHNPAFAGQTLEPYAHGYTWQICPDDGIGLGACADYRSVMAYGIGDWLPVFSNPDVTYSSEPVGDAVTADNARFVGEQFVGIANHRVGTGATAADCDLDGQPDFLEILGDASLDSNHNGQLDSCDLALGSETDCDSNGVPDTMQMRPAVHLHSEELTLGGFTTSPTTTFTGVPEAISGVTLTFTPDIAVGQNHRYVDISINGVFYAEFWKTDGYDCLPGVARRTIVLTAAEWNALGSDVEVEADFTFPLSGCGSDTILLDIEYTAINRQSDANADGIIDDCAPGCNIADVAAPFGVLDLSDQTDFVNAFSDQYPLADMNGDGIYDLDDIALFTNAFTAGCP